jgi:hypothetical protein
MTYRIKNTKTGQVGHTLYATQREAKASAFDHSKFHGVTCIVVDRFGCEIEKDYRGTRRNDAAQRMVDTFNFGRPAIR